MTEKMGNTEHKEEDSFALYTEKIVPKPSVKYRRLIRAAKFFVAAVLFGLIASGVMLLVYPALEKRMVQRNTDKEILTIERMNIRVKNRIIRKQKKRQPMTIMRQCYRQPMRQL